MTKKTSLGFKPYGNWLVLPDPTTRKTDAGIILDDATAKKMQTNILEVLACGPQCVQVNVGDTVMVDPRSDAMRTDIEDKAVVLINEHSILGIL